MIGVEARKAHTLPKLEQLQWAVLAPELLWNKLQSSATSSSMTLLSSLSPQVLMIRTLHGEVYSDLCICLFIEHTMTRARTTWVNCTCLLRLSLGSSQPYLTDTMSGKCVILLMIVMSKTDKIPVFIELIFW
jgi:hypothetical protein